MHHDTPARCACHSDGHLVFKKTADKDGSGRLDKAELRSSLTELNMKLDDAIWERYVEKNWELADVDENGRISRTPQAVATVLVLAEVTKSALIPVV